jgi:hypothetical protein
VVQFSLVESTLISTTTGTKGNVIKRGQSTTTTALLPPTSRIERALPDGSTTTICQSLWKPSATTLLLVHRAVMLQAQRRLAMQVNKTTKFTHVYDHFKPWPLTPKGIHLRGDGNTLYTHNQLMPHTKGTAAAADRQDKYNEAGPLIRQTIDQEHGDGVADTVFESLGLVDQVTLRDLKRIRDAILLLQPQQVAAKSDLSTLSGKERIDAHLVFRGASPELEHASQAFRKFLAKTEQPTIDFLDAYYALEKDPSPENLRAFVDDHLNNPDMNLYDYHKQQTIDLLAALGPSPTWAQIKDALDPVLGDVNESFADNRYFKFKASY